MGSGIDTLVRAFRDGSLPKDGWTHQAHLVVGLWHVERHGADGALPVLRDGIRRLNERHGTANTATGGYHETVTCAYVTLLAEFAERFSGIPQAERVATLLDSPLAGRDVLLNFYSPARLFHPDARRGWVAPDLAAIALDVVWDAPAQGSAQR